MTMPTLATPAAPSAPPSNSTTITPGTSSDGTSTTTPFAGVLAGLTPDGVSITPSATADTPDPSLSHTVVDGTTADATLLAQLVANLGLQPPMLFASPVTPIALSTAMSGALDATTHATVTEPTDARLATDGGTVTSEAQLAASDASLVALEMPKSSATTVSSPPERNASVASPTANGSTNASANAKAVRSETSSTSSVNLDGPATKNTAQPSISISDSIALLPTSVDASPLGSAPSAALPTGTADASTRAHGATHEAVSRVPRAATRTPATLANGNTGSQTINDQFATAGAVVVVRADNAIHRRGIAADSSTPGSPTSTIAAQRNATPGPQFITDGRASALNGAAANTAALLANSPAFSSPKGSRTSKTTMIAGVNVLVGPPASPANAALDARHGLGQPITPVATHTIAGPQSAAAARAATPPALEQILEAVEPMQHRPDGSYELKFELRPHDLGRVEVTVEMHKGVLSVHMRAEHAEAQALLRNHVEQLREMLTSRGVATGSLDVSDHRGHRHNAPDAQAELDAQTDSQHERGSSSPQSASSQSVLDRRGPNATSAAGAQRDIDTTSARAPHAAPLRLDVHV